jgi:hypothetical protein
MDFATHLLINGIFGVFLYWGLSRIFRVKHYERYGFIGIPPVKIVQAKDLARDIIKQIDSL